MADKILGRDHTNETAPTGTMTITVDNGTTNVDVALSNLYKALGVKIPVQTVHTQTGAVATGTTLLPVDDTIPQNTEGDQYMSQAITPTNASNKLLIEVMLVGSNSVVNSLTVALFQDATANALAVVTEHMTTATGTAVVSFKHEMTAGTTSATTFKVRAGGYTAGTMTFNGAAGTRYFGGTMASSIRITEYQV